MCKPLFIYLFVREKKTENKENERVFQHGRLVLNSQNLILRRQYLQIGCAGGNAGENEGEGLEGRLQETQLHPVWIL